MEKLAKACDYFNGHMMARVIKEGIEGEEIEYEKVIRNAISNIRAVHFPESLE